MKMETSGAGKAKPGTGNGEPRLRIALQKSGRLSEGCLELFKKCGLKIQTGKNQLMTEAKNFPADIIFTRDDDIPEFLSKGIADLGIFGENLLSEYTLSNPEQCGRLQTVLPLGFSKCRLSLAAKEGQAIASPKDFEGLVIATSYPKTLENFLAKEGVKAKTVVMQGSVELAPKIGFADAICDIVSSGATLRANGLREALPILESQAVFVQNPLLKTPAKTEILDRLLMRVKSVLAAEKSRYVMLHIDRKNLSALNSLLPGAESPTVLELEGRPDKAAVHIVVQEDAFWNTIETLKSIGASAILVTQIENMID